MTVERRLQEPVRDLVGELARGNFDALEADGRLPAGSGDQVRAVLEDYGGTFTELPEDAFDRSEAIELAEGKWGIDVELWTEEEGRTDLSVIVDVRVM